MQKIILELFSGSKIVSQTFEKAGWQSVTIDNNPKLKPSICKNILHIDKTDLPDHVDFIWASPVCTHFSRNSNPKHWIKITEKYRVYSYYPANPDSANSYQMVKKMVEIIQLYPNVPFIIENPVGRLRHMLPIKSLGHYRYGINYADFGFPYSKETYLFTNLLLPFSSKKVFSDKASFQTVNSRLQRSKVPAQLIKFIIPLLPDRCTT
jgi:site-specific DNA-cytosine methylase